MRATSTHRYAYAACYRPDWAADGLLVRNALARSFPPADSPTCVLIATLALPAGVNFYAALRATDPDTMITQKSYFELWSPLKRSALAVRRKDPSGRILVPNFLSRVSMVAIKRFISWHEGRLVQEIRRYSEGYLPARLNWLQLTRRLEACLPGSGFPPALVAYLNFVDDYAAPATF